LANLSDEVFSFNAVEMARKDRDFVIGFIAMKRLGNDDEDFLVLTPGVGLESKGDGMGQQYRTPSEVIKDSECDVIIVGRGIYKVKGEENVRNEAERYRQKGWEAYKERLA
jgi:orotidine-5'-phosphate decarboxylase